MGRLAVALLLVASTCGPFEPEGRQQTITFTTLLPRSEVRSRAEGWLGERAHYQVTSSLSNFVQGEKRQPRSAGPGEQIDILTVDISDAPEGGRRVSVQARTFLPRAGGAREQADELSPEASADLVSLVDVLNPRLF